MKYIGRKYVPFDNSYSLNLTGGKEEYLAGTDGTDPKECIIVSNPYQVRYLGSFCKELDFVNVFCEGEVHRVILYKNRIDKDINEAIKENKLHFARI